MSTETVNNVTVNLPEDDALSALSESQRARATALSLAVFALSGERGGPFTQAQNAPLPENRGTDDAVDLAMFILNGVHPTDRYDDEAEESVELTDEVEQAILELITFARTPSRSAVAAVAACGIVTEWLDEVR